ncbi:MAG TPA: hypothetical protein EYP14_19855 [Planctomycetaceae bacterium]|nr:hypothetical protein [Planctomycetaceae bacterium]
MFGNGIVKDILVALISGGAGAVVYRFLKTPAGRETASALGAVLRWIAPSPPEATRYTAMVLSAALAVAAYLAGVALGYFPMPPTLAAWVELVVNAFALAYGTSQVLHNRDLRARYYAAGR